MEKNFCLTARNVPPFYFLFLGVKGIFFSAKKLVQQNVGFSSNFYTQNQLLRNRDIRVDLLFIRKYHVSVNEFEHSLRADTNPLPSRAMWVCTCQRNRVLSTEGRHDILSGIATGKIFRNSDILFLRFLYSSIR